MNKSNVWWKDFYNILALFFLVAISAVLFIMNYWARSPFEARVVSAQVIDIDEKVIISFSQPVVSWEKDNIIFSSPLDFLAEMSEDRRTLNIYPRKGFEYEKRYEISLKDFKGASGLTLDTQNLFFYTKDGSLERNVLEEEKQQYGEIELAEDKYIPPSSSLVKEDYAPVVYISQGKYIDVSISHQIMTLYEDGIFVNQFLISSGKRGMPTPLGEFAVRKKETNHWSSTYKLWMPYSMNFYGPFYIHELPYWPSGYREGESHLGIQVSHGCIRLGIGPAKYVFDWADIGTPIYIHY